jgi:hypothetical protein
VQIEKSLKKKVKEECSLELTDLRELGAARFFFETDPFGHGKGTDTISIVYYAKGSGQLKLDELHSNPTIVKPGDLTKELIASLHPFVADFLKLAIAQLHQNRK